MKVIKSGKRNCGAFKFECDCCGCKFLADVSDYVFVDNIDFPTKNNCPSEKIMVECPHCGKKNYKNLYKKKKKIIPPMGVLFCIIMLTFFAILTTTVQPIESGSGTRIVAYCFAMGIQLIICIFGIIVSIE